MHCRYIICCILFCSVNKFYYILSYIYSKRILSFININYKEELYRLKFEGYTAWNINNTQPGAVF